MRFSDDYLLMTTNKDNAIRFIQTMKSLAESFGLKMSKFSKNFGNDFYTHSLLSKTPCRWVGLEIDMATLQIIPNFKFTKENALSTLNMNMKTKKSIIWLKNKLKSFLMNNVWFYFKSSINSIDYAKRTLEKLYEYAAVKFTACCKEFKNFHSRTNIAKTLDLQICKIFYKVIHNFYDYLVYNIE